MKKEILNFLAEASRTIYENKVASKLGIEYPSPIFDEMVEDKLIQRERLQEDYEVMGISITKKGLKKLDDDKKKEVKIEIKEDPNTVRLRELKTKINEKGCSEDEKDEIIKLLLNRLLI